MTVDVDDDYLMRLHAIAFLRPRIVTGALKMNDPSAAIPTDRCLRLTLTFPADNIDPAFSIPLVVKAGVRTYQAMLSVSWKCHFTAEITTFTGSTAMRGMSFSGCYFCGDDGDVEGTLPLHQ